MGLENEDLIDPRKVFVYEFINQPAGKSMVKEIIGDPTTGFQFDLFTDSALHLYNEATHGYSARMGSRERDYLNIFILKGENDKYAGLMIENINGARYVDIRYCPFCGRKIYDNDIKRKKNE